MKVPSPISGQTRAPSIRQQYLQPASNPGAGLGMLARGVASAGEAVAKLEATFRQRDEQTERFNTLKGFSEFQSDAAAALTELKRNYSADGKGFANAANELYRQKENEWLGRVPQDLQEEFRYRSQEVRRGVLNDALSFQYQAGDAWFQQGISDELSKSKTILDQNPSALEAEQKRIYEVIQASDLPLAQKQELARQATISLASVTYKAEVRQDPSKAGAIGVGNLDAKTLLRQEEGFRATPYWDVNTWRIGYGSDTITHPDGTTEKVRPGMKITREDAERDLEYRLTQREGLQAKKQLGETWDSLSSPVQAALASVAYNYGSLPDSVVKAAKSGSTEELANAVAGLSSNPGRRKREAAIIRGEKGLDTDPRFAAIPYEDRVALRADGDREYRAQQVAAAQQAKAERDASQNQLYLGLLDGNLGQVDIDNARANGILDDYDSVNKALKILNDRDAEKNLAMAGFEKLANNGVWDPGETEDKKMLNAMVKAGNGQQRLASGDANYVSDELVPLTNRVGDIPTDVAGTLMGMVRGADNARMMFALDSLAQLRDASGIAFDQRVSDDVAQQVDLWDTMKDVLPKEELLALVRGGTTQAERQQREVLRKEAQSILTRTEGGVVKGQTLLDEAIGEFGGTFWSAQTAAPLAKQALSKEFNTLWVDAYSKTGNEEKANELAVKALQRSWGVTSVGGGKDLMKFPPEKVGYKPYAGSYEWINRQARVELGLKSEEDFDLFSDEQTRQEFQVFQRDANAPPPSYRAFIKDENGVYRERTDERGLPLRINFVPDQETKDKEAALFDLKERKFLAQETIDNFMKLSAGSLGQEIPPEDIQAYQDALKELEEVDKDFRELSPDYFGEEIRNNMNSGGMF